MPGWTTLAGYVIVKGSLDVGFRVEPKHREPAEAQLALARSSAEAWPVCELPPAVPTEEGDAWDAWHRLDEYGRGYAASLVSLVESCYPDGEWRQGQTTTEDHSLRVGSQEPMLVRVTDGEVVGIVAPMLREPVAWSAIEQEG